MHDIICPHCHKAFKGDESGYADSLKQGGGGDLHGQLHGRLELAGEEKRNAVAQAKDQVANEVHGTALQLDITVPDAGERIARHVVERYGPDAVGVVLGNPNAHTVAGALYPPLLLGALRSRSLFIAATVDQMPKHVAAGLLFGDAHAIAASPYKLSGARIIDPRTSELREGFAEALYELRKAKEELFNLRFQSATGQLDNHGRLRAVRKDIARIYTEMRERELGIGVKGDAK